jgi:hypothetical protein
MQGPAPRHSGLPGPSRDEQRVAMLAKVEALITVLELARGKVLLSLSQRGSDLQRLGRVREQVEATLLVCRRARLALRNGGAPLTREQIRGTDLDLLCRRLSTWDVSGGAAAEN